MIKEEQNIANIFYPEGLLDREGFLIGFNFEGFLFVISAVIPRDKFRTLEELNSVIQEPKFQAFNKYCAGEPLLLGVIENEP